MASGRGSGCRQRSCRQRGCRQLIRRRHLRHAVAFADLIHDVLTAGDLAEHRVQAVEVRRLAQRERAARRELQEELNSLRAAMEAEEAEIAAMRERAGKAEFDARVAEFNDKVQETRRSVQRRNEDLQRRFVQSRQRVAEALPHVLAALMEEKGAAMVVDSRSVLVARPGADMTAEALAAFNEATADLFPDEPPAQE